MLNSPEFGDASSDSARTRQAGRVCEFGRRQPQRRDTLINDTEPG